MTKKRTVGAIAVFVFLTSHLASVRAADLIDTAAASGSFKTFIAAARATGLTATLKSQGPYTIFAPTDDAFSKLPTGTWNTLMEDKIQLAQILSYHIIPGKVLVAEVKPGLVKTVAGQSIKLTSDNGKITVDNAKVIESDIVADNGVIQAIDTVVLPK